MHNPATCCTNAPANGLCDVFCRSYPRDPSPLDRIGAKGPRVRATARAAISDDHAAAFELGEAPLDGDRLAAGEASVSQTLRPELSRFAFGLAELLAQDAKGPLVSVRLAPLEVSFDKRPVDGESVGGKGRVH